MFDGAYLDWNQKRIKAFVEYYGHPFFFGKRVLDLGCGYGDISGVLHRLGADITAVDARQEHLKIIDKKYPGVKMIRADLDRPWIFYGKKFDLILDLALINHLQNFEEHLRAACASADYFILESAVADSDDAHFCLVKPDNKNVYDRSFNGFNSQISAANIERVLTENGMSFNRVDSAKFNSGPYNYDWRSNNDGSYDFNKRRIWFCVKNGNHIPATNATNVLPAINVGDFIPNISDSRVPITHQHLMTSRSPTLPGGGTTRISPKLPPLPAMLPYNSRSPIVSGSPPPTPVISNPPTRSVKNTNKMRLFYNYYKDSNPIRQQEIDLCLKNNIENQHFDIIIVESADNPTFDLMFEAVNRLSGPNDISIICNADISFDNTITFSTRLRPKDVYALGRWDFKNNISILFDTDRTQNAWIFRGKIEGVKGNFQMGKPSSDNRIAYELQAAGYNVINPSRSIKAHHVHSSGIKHYNTTTDTISGEYLYLPPTSL